MDLNINPNFLRKILKSKISNVTKKEKEYGICCDQKMEPIEAHIICKICGTVKKNMGDYTNNPESQIVQFASNGTIRPGENIKKSIDDRISIIYKEYHQKITSNINQCYNESILREASKLMHTFSVYETKKSDNRDQLFAACLFYASVQEKNILLKKDLVAMLNLKKGGISEGISYITKCVVETDINFELDPPVYKLINKYFLQKLIIDGKSLESKENKKFCNAVVEFLIGYNIGYNSEILAKCAAAIYYMLEYCGLHNKKKKNVWTAEMTLKQNIYSDIHKLLVHEKINKMMPKHLQLEKFKK